MKKREFVIYDRIRNKFVYATEEEFIRQKVINHLIENMRISPLHIAVEKRAPYKKTRFDILVFSRNLKPLLLIECKKPEENINEQHLAQLLNYNRDIKARFICLTNWDKWLIAELLENNSGYRILDSLKKILELY